MLKLKIKYIRGFLGASVVKNLPGSAEEMGSVPGPRSSPGGGNGNLPGKSHGQRNLAGCSPCGCVESDTTY